MTDHLTWVYWGKAKPGQGLHLLVFHSLDVAAVGRKYLERADVFVDRCCCELQCSRAAFLAWASFWLALHDLGKFAEAFQGLREDLLERLQQRRKHPNKKNDARHDSLGYWLGLELLADEELLQALGFANDRQTRGFRHWLGAVCGHHGMPPQRDDGNLDSYFREQDKQAARAFVLEVAALLLTDEARQIPARTTHFEKTSTTLSWWFAGLCVLADWLGSNVEYFPYHDEPQELESYWVLAQIQAKTALEHAGVVPVAIANDQQLQDFFGYIEDPTPLQSWVENVELAPEPQIHLLEDVTGAGKTEAAIMLAYRMMNAGLASGFYIGLPTMATANAMYQRIAKVYAQLFAGDASLVLAQGQRDLVQAFAVSVLPADVAENDARQPDESASARCSAWLADHNKRALLAPAGVGTIDQVLLAVLHSKHQSLRLLGLFDKVLLVDEVHACDAYMLGVLEIVLEFHARMGGSAILLSATLPERMKQKLLMAYANGRNAKLEVKPMKPDYPLASYWHVGLDVLKEEKIQSRKEISRTVHIHYEADLECVYAHIVTALAQGQCVGWIRNTVADAMDAYARLAQSVPEDKLTLFHARFTLHDRLAKEHQVLENFGKESDANQRKGRVVLATQVAEQSLDVDFDVLISDLAPIDCILQRAGRLQRHTRDKQGNRNECESRNPPCLWVFGPVWSVAPRTDWYAATFKKARYVYPHHGQLWLTAQLLQNNSFSMPTNARHLIETVYSGLADIPESLQAIAIQVEGDQIGQASIAQANTLKLDEGYKRGEIGDWWDEAATPSRLGEKTQEIMLARWQGDSLQPWVEGVWAYSMLKLPARQLARVELPHDAARRSAYERLLLSLPKQGRWSLLLPLEPGPDGVWQAQAWTSEDSKRPECLHTWLYDERFGMRIKTDTTDT